MRRKKFSIITIALLICSMLCAQQKSELHQRAEAEDAKNNVVEARSAYIHAFNEYVNKGQVMQGVECGARATALYYKENLYKEAFELLRRIDQSVNASSLGFSDKSAARYMTTRERLQMYIKLRKNVNAQEQLKQLEHHAGQAGKESISNDLLYNKAIYYYTFGQVSEGNAAFKEMASKLTASKEYDKVDEVYQKLIYNGRKSGNANIVAQSYSNYLAWKDSTSAIRHADEIAALRQQIADGEATIAERDHSLSTRRNIIVGLCVLAGALTAALVLTLVVLLRFILLTRKQKKTIHMANESNALKAKFINNITSQLSPTLNRLDCNQAEVKAMITFTQHVQMLSELENTQTEPVALEDTQVTQYCEELINQVRGNAKSSVVFMVKAPKMNAHLNREYVSHILLHLLERAAQETPDNGTITLEFKKRSPHTYQFLVSDTGTVIPEEQRDSLFTPFREICDLTQGDGLDLPICRQMALKMHGDINIDPTFTKGTRFVLDLHI